MHSVPSLTILSCNPSIKCYSPSRPTRRGGGLTGLKRNPGDPSYGKQHLKEKNRPRPPPPLVGLDGE